MFILESTTLEFSKEVCRSMVAMLDFDKSGKLGIDELKCLFNEITMWRVSILPFCQLFSKALTLGKKFWRQKLF
jgi:hypothetical protein